MFILTHDSLSVFTPGEPIKKLDGYPLNFSHVKLWQGDVYMNVGYDIYKNKQKFLSGLFINFWFIDDYIISLNISGRLQINNIKTHEETFKMKNQLCPIFVDDRNVYTVKEGGRSERYLTKYRLTEGGVLKNIFSTSIDYETEFSNISSIYDNILLTNDGDLWSLGKEPKHSALSEQFRMLKISQWKDNKLFVVSKYPGVKGTSVGIFDVDTKECKSKLVATIDEPTPNANFTISDGHVYVWYANGFLVYNDEGVEVSRLAMENIVLVLPSQTFD